MAQSAAKKPTAGRNNCHDPLIRSLPSCAAAVASPPYPYGGSHLSLPRCHCARKIFEVGSQDYQAHGSKVHKAPRFLSMPSDWTQIFPTGGPRILARLCGLTTCRATPSRLRQLVRAHAYAPRQGRHGPPNNKNPRVQVTLTLVEPHPRAHDQNPLLAASLQPRLFVAL